MKKKIDFKFIANVFNAALDMGKFKLKPNSKFGEVPDWDSLGHMRIIQELEKRLDVQFDIDEIVDVDTVKKVIQLAKNKIN